MQKSKPIRILQSLSAWELKSLDEYIRSPFFNKNKRVLEAWEFIYGFAPDFIDKRLTMESCFGAVFPEETFQAQKLRYLMTDLTRLIEGFLVYQSQESRPYERGISLLEAFEQRGLEKDFQETYRKLEKKALAEELKESDQFLQRFLLAEKKYLFEVKNQKRSAQSTVDEVITPLDQFYLSKKLRYACELINRANVLNQDYNLFLIREINQTIPDFSHLQHHLIRLYHITLQTLIDGDNEDHFFQLKKLLVENYGQISQDEIRNLYAFALNYCIKKLNTGKSEFAQQIFELYQILVEKRIIFEHGVLPVPHFKNTVTIGTRMQAYEWVEAFIENYHSFLPPEEAQNAYTYNMAYLQFSRGNYRRVKRLLNTVEFTDVFYQTDAKTTLIKTYYELGEYEPLIYLLGSFKVYLKRNQQLSDYQRKLYLNLIKITWALVKYQVGEKITIDQIKERMDRMPNIAGKQWVSQKIGEL
jgi:hypothetical protein